MWCRDLRSTINVFFSVGRMRRRIPAYDHLGGDDLGATLAFGLGFLGHPPLHDRRDIDRNIVPCDDLLRGDLHGDGAQGHAHDLLDRYVDQRQPRSRTPANLPRRNTTRAYCFNTRSETMT